MDVGTVDWTRTSPVGMLIAGVVYENSLHPAHPSCESKTTLKIVSLLKILTPKTRHTEKRETKRYLEGAHKVE